MILLNVMDILLQLQSSLFALSLVLNALCGLMDAALRLNIYLTC